MATSHTDIDQGAKHSGATVIEYRRARMWGRIDIGLTMISLSGEIDASNIDDLSRHARRLVPDHGALIVDLTDTDFIGVEGLHVLFALNIDCARTETTWAVIVSHAANRLLRVAGEHGKRLPAVGSATEALRVIRETGANNRTAGTTRFRANSDSSGSLLPVQHRGGGTASFRLGGRPDSFGTLAVVNQLLGDVPERRVFDRG